MLYLGIPLTIGALLAALAAAIILLLRIRRLKAELAEQERVVRRLGESERRYRFIVDHSTDVMWQLDRDLKISYVSDAAWALGGFAPKDMIGTQLSDLITASSYADLSQRLGFLTEYPLPTGSDPFMVELEMFRSNGSTVWVEVHATALRTSQGDIVGYFGTTRDISDRKRAEAALAASEAKFRLLLEGAPFAVTILRLADGLILYANQRAADMLGAAVEHIVGDHVEGYFVDAGTKDEIATTLQAKGHISGLEIRLKRADGSAFWALHSSRLVEFEGTLSAFVAFSDISNNKRVEADLTHVNTLLQKQIEEVNSLQAQLREQAVRDGLTGLFNRRYLDETLGRELARAKKEKTALALVMLDVDHFKQVNDRFGHQTGDEVLKALARLLVQSTRIEDIVCRYGGEEFAVMLPGTPSETARLRAEQWRTSFAELVVKRGEASLRATISLGVVAYPEYEVDADTLVQLSDQALYQAKRSGRNCTVVYGAEAKAASQGPG